MGYQQKLQENDLCNSNNFVTFIYCIKNTNEFHPSAKSMKGVEPFSTFTKRVNYGHVRKFRLSSLSIKS